MSSPSPRPTNIDPLMQAVFDALDAFMDGTPWTSSTASLTLDGSAATHSMNVQQPDSSSINYTERKMGTRVSVSPASVTLGPGQTQQFAAAATNPDGSDAGGTFAWAVTGGTLGTVDATGLYTAPATIAAASVVSVSASLVGGQSWASATVSLTP